MTKYLLMHKDSVCGSMIYDEMTGRIAGYHDEGKGLSPFLGNCDIQKIRKWWEMRAVPASRNMIQKVIRESGCFNPESYLAKNLALSMTDCYWICPENILLTYDEVKFSNLVIYNEGKVPYHNATSYDPNASLGGQMEKYWELDHEIPVLVKESYKYFGQQSINEVFATYVHELQKSGIPFVKYTASVTEDHGILCKCDAFTSEHIEFIPAYEVLESQKTRNETSLYDSYIDICVENGIERDSIQDFMDYQTMTDFVISNTDEHLLNFGILRNSDSMKVIGPAPVFDSGNSMFYSDERKIPYTRAGLLERKITGFYKSEEKILEKVKNRNIVKEDLFPAPKEVKEIYESSGVPAWKAEIISKNYETKLQFVREFQKGKSISLYQERRNEKKQLKKQTQSEAHLQKFIMICGNPGSGKSRQADNLFKSLKHLGCHEMDSKELYTVEDAVKDTGFLLDKQRILKKLQPKSGYQGAVVRVSTEDIRYELKAKRAVCDEDMISLIADARIETALLSGASVIFDTSKSDRNSREYYIGLADRAGVYDRSLYFSEKSKPSYDEGWTEISTWGC